MSTFVITRLFRAHIVCLFDLVHLGFIGFIDFGFAKLGHSFKMMMTLDSQEEHNMVAEQEDLAPAFILPCPAMCCTGRPAAEPVHVQS